MRAKSLRPFGPGSIAVRRMDGSKHRVLVNPPRLRCQERRKSRCAGRRARQLGRDETVGSRAERDSFQLTDRAVIDLRRPPHIFEPRSLVVGQRRLAADGLEFRHSRHVDVERVDGHGADSRIRRVLPRRHFVDRQQLHDALSGRRQPACHGIEIPDVADAPARRPWAGEQRHHDAGPAASLSVRHGRRRVPRGVAGRRRCLRRRQLGAAAG